MKKLLPVLFLFLLSQSKAQTFSNTVGGPIHDPPYVEIFPIIVSGLPNVIDTSFGLSAVCFDIVHTYDGDLNIELQSPDGNSILLSNNNGGGGDDFTGTCVAEDATGGEIHSAYSPFTGIFFPDEWLTILNNGQNPNGTWNLIITDEAPQDTGQLIQVSITFENNPPPHHAGGPCTTANAFGCNCPDGTQDCDLLPDMVNSELYLAQNWSEHSGYIREGVATPNIGYGPLQMEGTGECFCDTTIVSCSSTCPDGSSPKEKVNQIIYHKNGTVMSTYAVPAGTMTYHPSHGHIHVDNWTYNSLRIRGPESDPRMWPIISFGTKVSFCLINLGTCSLGNGYCQDQNNAVYDQNTMHNGGLGAVTGCGEQQGIYVGNYDAYDQGLDGQEIDFGNICNGEYYLVSITDPYNFVTETNDDNNVAYTLISLYNQMGNCCNVTFKADTTHGDAPFEVMFIDSTVPVANSWLWDFGDGSTSTLEFPQHVYTQPGVYTVKLIAHTSANCNDTTTRTNYITVTNGLGVVDLNNAKNFELTSHPNPFNSQTTISYHLDAPAYLQLSVVDVVGNTVKVLFDGNQHSGDHDVVFDAKLEGLSNGFYFIHAIAGSKEYFVKMVKVD